MSLLNLPMPDDSALDAARQASETLEGLHKAAASDVATATEVLKSLQVDYLRLQDDALLQQIKALAHGMSIPESLWASPVPVVRGIPIPTAIELEPVTVEKELREYLAEKEAQLAAKDERIAYLEQRLREESMEWWPYEDFPPETPWADREN